ncbi:MAG: hypothetical protein WAU49_06880, partial [Steroidobacteraceae bacterium]
MPTDLRVVTAQFENRSGDKLFNLAAIDELSAKAARLGAHVVAFHECSITGCAADGAVDVDVGIGRIGSEPPAASPPVCGCRIDRRTVRAAGH